MHTVWKGAISFGLVYIPVKLHSATEEKEISMKQLHKDCCSPISQVKRCAACDTEVSTDHIIRGYEYEKNSYVLFDKDELTQLTGEKDKELKIIEFILESEVDPVYFQKTYYLSPDDIGKRGYLLLQEAMTFSKKIAICKISIRSRISLALLRVKDNCLILETLFYPDEVRSHVDVPNLPDSTQSSNNKELHLAQKLIDQLSGNFKPESYRDEYRERLIEAIQDKIAGQSIRTVHHQAKTNVLDLMSALQASLNETNVPIEKKERQISKKANKKKVAIEESAS
jgi:DNA end-binding protein Ku